MNNKTKGIICIIASAFFFSLMSLFVRMAGDLPTMEKAFFRNAIAAIFAIIILSRTPEKFHIKRESWPDLLRRSIYGTMGVILNFWAIVAIAFFGRGQIIIRLENGVFLGGTESRTDSNIACY